MGTRLVTTHVFDPRVGDLVRKVGGDYKFDGIVVAEFKKLSGVRRCVVEDDRGVLHIYSAKNLEMRKVTKWECLFRSLLQFLKSRLKLGGL